MGKVACVHRWVIESADSGRGKASGVCRKCGAEREFSTEEPVSFLPWARVRKGRGRPLNE